MSFEEKIAGICAERQEIQAQQQATAQRVTDASQALTKAMSERDRLQGVCAAFEKEGEHEPPYADLGRAALAADRAAIDLETVEREARITDQATRERLSALGQEEAAARREHAVSEFRNAVVQYEQIIQRARLAFLSDEIRRLADLASIRLEPYGPLIDRDFLSIGNYPINAWVHSAADGTSPLAATDDEYQEADHV